MWLKLLTWACCRLVAEKHSGSPQSTFPHSQEEVWSSFFKLIVLSAAVFSLSIKSAALTGLNNLTDTESPKCRSGCKPGREEFRFTDRWKVACTFIMSNIVLSCSDSEGLLGSIATVRKSSWLTTATVHTEALGFSWKAKRFDRGRRVFRVMPGAIPVRQEHINIRTLIFGKQK